MLTPLKCPPTASDSTTLLDQAATRELALRVTWVYLYEQEVVHQEQRRIQMGLSIALFPSLRALDGFGFRAQPLSIPVRFVSRPAGTGLATAMSCHYSVRRRGQGRLLGLLTTDTSLVTHCAV
ncbi:hypothetical protein [Halomonas sp.]|uniref:hypothetical protein n=1 Tax=Halomonas sp. TaxID=1486246 RepID=UPI00298E454E|nr:hypothetical protein [Halomonas sp.]MDW7748630.1 hypothetical protein [Halomonas sp.]